jgi:hypothetical protein
LSDSLTFEFCWQCGSHVNRQLTPQGFIKICPICAFPTVPEFVEVSTFESLEKWWKTQLRLLASLRFSADPAFVDDYKRRHPKYREDPELAHILSLAKLISETFTTFCMVCGVQLDRRRQRTVKKALCDQHYSDFRKRHKVETQRERRKKGPVGAKLKDHERAISQQLPFTMVKYWLKLGKYDRKSLFDPWFFKEYASNPKFVDWLKKQPPNS